MRTVLYVIAFLLLCDACSSRFTCLRIFQFFNSEHAKRCTYCHEEWNEQDFEGLKTGIRQRLFGQHIARDIVERLVRIHLQTPSPTSALVLSLHGATGSGKNYLTEIILQHLFKDGRKNIYVKYWNAKGHFSDENKLAVYKEDVKRTVMNYLRDCERSVFIFDEANELPAGLLDTLTPMMDENASLDGVDCTKAIFFFLSNTGAAIIKDIVLKLQGNGLSRTDIKVNHFQSAIDKGAFDEKGGFQYSVLIQKKVIDSYIPFLPMEKGHIKLCIEYYLRSRNCNSVMGIIDELAGDVIYEDGIYSSFAKFGCRGVEELIMRHVDDNCILNKAKTEL